MRLQPEGCNAPETSPRRGVGLGVLKFFFERPPPLLVRRYRFDGRRLEDILHFSSRRREGSFFCQKTARLGSPLRHTSLGRAKQRSAAAGIASAQTIEDAAAAHPQLPQNSKALTFKSNMATPRTINAYAALGPSKQMVPSVDRVAFKRVVAAASEIRADARASRNGAGAESAIFGRSDARTRASRDGAGVHGLRTIRRGAAPSMVCQPPGDRTQRGRGLSGADRGDAAGRDDDIPRGNRASRRRPALGISASRPRRCCGVMEVRRNARQEPAAPRH